jgi:hypothetical protein
MASTELRRQGYRRALFAIRRQVDIDKQENYRSFFGYLPRPRR